MTTNIRLEANIHLTMSKRIISDSITAQNIWSLHEAKISILGKDYAKECASSKLSKQLLLSLKQHHQTNVPTCPLSLGLRHHENHLSINLFLYAFNHAFNYSQPYHTHDDNLSRLYTPVNRDEQLLDSVKSTDSTNSIHHQLSGSVLSMPSAGPVKCN